MEPMFRSGMRRTVTAMPDGLAKPADREAKGRPLDNQPLMII
jgi:hypothetical protein